MNKSIGIETMSGIRTRIKIRKLDFSSFVSFDLRTKKKPNASWMTERVSMSGQIFARKLKSGVQNVMREQKPSIE